MESKKTVTCVFIHGSSKTDITSAASSAVVRISMCTCAQLTNRTLVWPKCITIHARYPSCERVLALRNHISISLLQRHFKTLALKLEKTTHIYMEYT